MKKCKVDGVRYIESPLQFTNNICDGCAGQNKTLCRKLPDCGGGKESFIWVKLDTEEEQPPCND